MGLSDRQRSEIEQYLKQDRPLPDNYRFLLFKKPSQVELLWDGKSRKTTDVVLPFQTIEQIDEPRTELPSGTLNFDVDLNGRQIKGWTNKLIWGDNKYILSSLKNGHLRDQIKEQGGIKLIYIDPPFDVGADFSMEVSIPSEESDKSYVKEPNVLEQLAYRDTWGKGQDSFLCMIYERLILMRDLLSDDGSIYVHCDWRMNSLLRLAMDEIFGKENFRNEIVWGYKTGGTPRSKARSFAKKHDTILFYSKIGESHNYNEEKEISYNLTLPEPHTNSGKRLNVHRDTVGKYRYTKMRDWWVEYGVNKETDITPLYRNNIEITGYPTQKPEKLIERIIKASSNEEDLVCDFFVGSGTTAATCEKLNRKWICADLGKFAIHTTRKRMIGVQRELKEKGTNYRPFEVLNIGRYQREYFIYNSKCLDRKDVKEKERNFEKLILQAYKAFEVKGFKTFQGKKDSRFISIGPVNHPVSRLQIEQVILESIDNRITKVDILGFEYEMGLFPNIREEATKSGIDLQFKYIPSEIFDKRAVERGDVKFYDVSYIEVKPIIEGNRLSIELIDFATFHNLDNLEKIKEKLKRGKDQVIVTGGNVIKISKDKYGITNQEILTKKWSDWVDYWSVDFDFQNRKEMIKIKSEITNKWEEKWTGDYVFDNEWQSFRTKGNTDLELVTTPKEISTQVTKVAIKVVDIFGNDTMKVIDVKMR